MNLFKVALECYESRLLEIMWSVIIQGSIMYNFVPLRLEVRKRPSIGNLVFQKCLSAKRLVERKGQCMCHNIVNFFSSINQ